MPPYDITVIIATCNRDSLLSDTLNMMSRLDADGLRCEFVVVDNNSTDDTPRIVSRLQDRMPLRYLFEGRPGQNFARNKAIDDGGLGRIVAFTDDDVVPHLDWLQQIRRAADENPGHGVFGGKIYPILPIGPRPPHTDSPTVRSFAWAEHDRGDNPLDYPVGSYPFSGNFWLRHELLRSRRFSEKTAWTPTDRIMATETSLLKELQQQGVRSLYYPASVIGHRIDPQQMPLAYILRRAYSWGRGDAWLVPLCRSRLFERFPLTWYSLRSIAVARQALRAAVALLPARKGCCEPAIDAIRWMAYDIESMKIAFRKPPGFDEEDIAAFSTRPRSPPPPTFKTFVATLALATARHIDPPQGNRI